MNLGLLLLVEILKYEFIHINKVIAMLSKIKIFNIVCFIQKSKFEIAKFW